MLNSETGRNQNDIFRPASIPQIKNLLKIHEKNFHFYIIYNHLKWLKYVEQSEDRINIPSGCALEFYVPVNAVPEYGTFISITEGNNYNISFHTLQDNYNELFEALSKTNRIKWNRGPWLNQIHSDLMIRFKEVFLYPKKLKWEEEIPCTSFILSKNDAIKFNIELPKEYEITNLQPENVHNINKVWEYKHDYSEDIIATQIKINGGLGIYKSKSDQLVGWVISNEFSGPGYLHVTKEERRKGFGAILLKAISKKIARTENIDVISFVAIGNVNSWNLFQQTGFKTTDLGIWLKIKKNISQL